MAASPLEIKMDNFRNRTDNMSATNRANSFSGKYHIDRTMNAQWGFANKNFAAPRANETSDESELLTDPQGSVARYAMSADIYLSHMGGTHVGGFGAEVITSDDNSTFFSRAFTLNFFQQGYSAGEIVGESVVFHTGQYIYTTDDGEKAYMYAAYMSEDEDWPEIVDSFVMTKDENGKFVSSPGYYFMVMTEEEAEGGINEATDIICFGTNYVFTPLPDNLTESKLPDDADVFECQMSANSLYDEGARVMKDVTVGVSGDNIYIGGLCDYLPECYLTGTKTSDNTFTFSTHQYIGYYDEGDYPYIYEFAMVNPLYFDGESLFFNEAESVNMTFDENLQLLTLEEDAGVFNCAYGDVSSWNELYWNMTIGDFNQPLTPTEPTGVECYGSGSVPYIIFEWSNISTEGLPMNDGNLWCEVIVNGEAYIFLPEHYEGLEEPTEKIYFNTSGVDGIYPGAFSTIYLYEFDGESDSIKTIGVKAGYQSGDETKYSDLIYAKGFEPFEDNAFVPSSPCNLVYYKDYYNNLRFKFDGKDVEGNVIPERLLAIEILLDGEVLIFKDSDYYFNNGEGADETMVGLSENSINYSSSLVTDLGGEYILSLWGHDELPDFKTIAIRPVCIGGNTVTYGESCEITLERPATPANPWDVAYDYDSKELTFGALPIDTDECGLAPWNYGYEIYVNDELYLFKGELYDLENDITLIPYEGFEYNYNFYLNTEYVYDETTWSIIDKKMVMSVSMDKEDGLDIQKIGVRAVYTDEDGNTTYSDIINSDGTIGTVGIDNVRNDNGQARWYNLQGIEVASTEAGTLYLRQQGGKTTKVYVK